MNLSVKKISKNNIINKGTGAGGANTTKSGNYFENITSNEKNLTQEQGFFKKSLFVNKKLKGYFLEKIQDNVSYIHVIKKAFGVYVKQIYNIDVIREPDEAYITHNNNNITIRIIEKKNQNANGSVDIKLWAGPSLKQEYEILFGDKYKIEYAFCLSAFFKEKFDTEVKYKILHQILQSNKIIVLYGNDKDYFDKLNKWIFT